MHPKRVFAQCRGLLFAVVGVSFFSGCGNDRPAPSTTPIVKTARIDPFSQVPRPPAREATFTPVDDRIAIAKAMLRGGKFEDAETALRTILRDHPDDPQTTLLLGLAIHKQKRYSDARASFEAVLATEQTFPEIDSVFYLYGWCAYYLGELPLAKRAFLEHQRRVPGEPDTVFALGIIALDDGDLNDAETQLRLAIVLQSSRRGAERELAKAYARLGDVYTMRDQWNDARTALETAVRLHPDHYEAWAKLARVLDRLGLNDEAASARVNERAAMERGAQSR